MIRTLCSLAVIASAAASANAAGTTVFYDGALGTAPTAQGLSYGAFPIATYYTTSGGVTTLDTSSTDSISAGFTNSTAVTLDRTVGYTIALNADVLSSAFTNSSRAGFSLIALSSDKRGIELGFHDNEIFAQGDSPLFVRAESVSFDTTAGTSTSYELQVLGNTYTLRANGVTTLTGALRDYSAFAGFPDPYETPNFIFLGDDTTSARGSTAFSYVAVTVPEPTALCGIAATLLLGRRRRA